MFKYNEYLNAGKRVPQLKERGLLRMYINKVKLTVDVDELIEDVTSIHEDIVKCKKVRRYCVNVAIALSILILSASFMLRVPVYGFYLALAVDLIIFIIYVASRYCILDTEITCDDEVIADIQPSDFDFIDWESLIDSGLRGLDYLRAYFESGIDTSMQPTAEFIELILYGVIKTIELVGYGNNADVYVYTKNGVVHLHVSDCCINFDMYDGDGSDVILKVTMTGISIYKDVPEVRPELIG